MNGRGIDVLEGKEMILNGKASLIQLFQTFLGSGKGRNGRLITPCIKISICHVVLVCFP